MVITPTAHSPKMLTCPRYLCSEHCVKFPQKFGYNIEAATAMTTTKCCIQTNGHSHSISWRGIKKITPTNRYKRQSELYKRNVRLTRNGQLNQPYHFQSSRNLDVYFLGLKCNKFLILYSRWFQSKICEPVISLFWTIAISPVAASEWHPGQCYLYVLLNCSLLRRLTRFIYCVTQIFKTWDSDASLIYIFALLIIMTSEIYLSVTN